MSSAAHATPFASLNAVIETCVAELEVTSPTGPISSPETLLAALRTEILPVLSDVLEAPEWQGIALRVDHIEIDLGTWPDDPAWSDVRYVFARKLRDALAHHLPVLPQDSPEAFKSPDIRGPNDGVADVSANAAKRGTVDGDKISPVEGLKDPRSGVSSAGYFPSDAPDVTAPLVPERSVTQPVANVPGAGLPSVSGGPALRQEQAAQNLGPRDNMAERSAQQTTANASDKSMRDLATATAAFQSWVEVQTSPLSVADVLAHVAAHPEQVEALVAWQNMPQAAREHALRLSQDVQQSVSAAAARLASSVRAQPKAPASSRSDTPLNSVTEASRKDRNTADQTDTLNADTEPDTQDTTETEDKSAKAADHPYAVLGDRNSRGLDGYSGNDAATGRIDARSLGPAARFGISNRQTPTTAAAPSASFVPPGDGASGVVGDPLSSREALDHIRAALTSDAPDDRHLKAAARRLTVSFERTGLSRDASENAAVSALARVQSLSLFDDGTWSGKGAPNEPPEIASTATVSNEGRRDTPAEHDAGSPTATQTPPASSLRASIVDETRDVSENMQTRFQTDQAADTQAALEKLADLLGLDTDRALIGQLADAVSRMSQSVFKAAAQADALDRLAVLFANVQEPLHPLMIHLSPAQLRRLAAANAAAMARAAMLLSETQALALVHHLLPPEATLLRGEIEALRGRAKSPVRALQQAVIALLQNTSLDMEDLVALPAVPQEQPLEPVQNGGSDGDVVDVLSSDPSKQPERGTAPETPLKAIPALPASWQVGSSDDPVDATPFGLSREPETESAKETPLDDIPALPKSRQRGFSDDLMDATPFALSRKTGNENVTETPLETILALSGLNATEVDRVMGRGAQNNAAQAPSSGQTEDSATPAVRSDSQKSSREATGADMTDKTTDQRPLARPLAADMARDDAVLRSHVSRLALEDVQPGPTEETLSLIWQFWPQSIPKTGSDAVYDFALVRARIATLITPAETLLEQLATATQAIEPDEEKRVYALRTVAARLAVYKGPDPTGQRETARAMVDALLLPQTPAPKPDAQPAAMRALYNQSTQFTDRTGSGVREETLRVTETAGLVLLHPFYVLLFDRLQIAREGKGLLRRDLPRALGALHYLAGDDPADDPLQRLLLGLDVSLPLPEPEAPDAEGEDLMTGLLRSVVDRWGRLGATSPDGLREAFIQRTGSLRFDAAGAHLRVTPGPFDMLLDGLPWSIGQVALPWMPLPCYVSWREDNDA